MRLKPIFKSKQCWCSSNVRRQTVPPRCQCLASLPTAVLTSDSWEQHGLLAFVPVLTFPRVLTTRVWCIVWRQSRSQYHHFGYSSSIRRVILSFITHQWYPPAGWSTVMKYTVWHKTAKEKTFSRESVNLLKFATSNGDGYHRTSWKFNFIFDIIK